MKLSNGHFSFETYGEDGDTKLPQSEWKIEGHFGFGGEDDEQGLSFSVEFTPDERDAIMAICERAIARRMAQIGRALTEYQERKPQEG